MNIEKSFILTLLAFMVLSNSVQAAGLDEIYRDIVRSDNRGYLPMFVKNRNIPDFLLEDEMMKQVEVKQTKPEDIKAVNLENERKKREAALLAEQQKWQETLTAVRTNRLTPVELEEILKRVDKNQPDAVEIYAWMNARGVGIQPDLIKAFSLYQKAASLNVPNATKNAAQVYKIMTPAQRESLNAFKN